MAYNKHFDKNDIRETEYSSKCSATGCPMRGTISNSGGEGSFVCAPHFQGQPDEWPRITESLIESLEIRLAIDEIMKIDDLTWETGVRGCNPKSKMFERYFNDDPLRPQGKELLKKPWYEYRLRNELMFIAGLCKKPQVRQE
tara:strand:+ start:39 stop:464 length:426 start_codon:yes stop_codon:yes gene_type:complete